MRSKLPRADKKPTAHSQKRSSSEVALNSAERVIDFDRYVPTVVSRLMTKLRASAQTYFGERHGITRLDWRIISFLTAKGPSSAYDIWTFGNLDKAAVSRALKVLEQRKLVTIKDVPDSTRRRTIVSLTRAGRDLNDKAFVEIVKRHQRLMGKLTPSQIDTFIQTARYLEDRIPFMDQDNGEPASDYDVTQAPAAKRRKGV